MNPTEHKSDTPETDSIWKTLAVTWSDHFGYEHRKACQEAVRNAVEELERERDQARRERDEARREVVYSFDEDEVPTFRDGITCPHELESRVDAERCKFFVREIVKLRARVGELETKLTALGNLAVADWNDAIVGEVDKLIPSQTQKKYSEVLRDLFVTIPARAKELKKDKERLDWIDDWMRNNREQFSGLVHYVGENVSDPENHNRSIRHAIDEAMKGQE